MICPVCLRSSLSPDVQICEKVSTGLWLSYAIHMNSIRMQMQFIFSAEGIAENLRHSIFDKDGFVLLQKRLDGNGRFQWPRNASEARLLTRQEFRWLMEGLSIDQPKAIKGTGRKKGFLILCAKQRILNFLYP